jgi:hypothetical protein
MHARAFRVVTTFMSRALLALAAGCGGGSSTQTSSLAPDTVTINPESTRLGRSGTRTFTSSGNVIWAVQESGGGSVTADGIYTAPAIPGTYHVVATSAVDESKTATATIHVVQSRFTWPMP